MDLKLKIEERLEELRQAAMETEAQLWAIRGAMQELETVILPFLEQAYNVKSDDSIQGDE